MCVCLLTYLFLKAFHVIFISQAAYQEASRVSEEGHWDCALPLLTVAVQAVDELKLQYLRQRAACLAQLALHERAVADLDKVIQGHAVTSKAEHALLAEDLCRRGHSLLLCSREQQAVEDFSQALGLHRVRALECAEVGVGRARLAGHFLHAASRCYAEQQLSEAWILTERGLQVESGHTELRRLRARIKQESSSSCIVH